jgi:hypothetical protein
MQLQQQTVEGWSGVLSDLAIKRAAALDHVERLRGEKKALALEAALGGADARKRLEKINSELSLAALRLDDMEQAVIQAESKKQGAQQAEADAVEQERRLRISAALSQYLGHVREIDDAMQVLATKFTQAHQALDRGESLMTGAERGPLQQLRSLWGATLAAAHFGLDGFIGLGPQAAHQTHRKPLAEFTASYLESWTGPQPKGADDGEQTR